MAAKESVHIALIGMGFMGRTHSNAWSQVSRFFQPPLVPVMHTVFGRDGKAAAGFAARWGWQNARTNYRAVVADAAVDLVDIVTPTFAHAEVALAAIRAGKNICCEKPIAGTLDDARSMVQAAAKAKIKTFVGYNYRRCPAVALAHQLVREGRLGEITRVRGFYLQDWAGPGVPMIWRFDKKRAGSGSQGDLNAHVVDMVRFVTGQEVIEVPGAIVETFVKERYIQAEQNAAGGIAAGASKGAKKAKVTVDDTVMFLARFSGGAVGSFEAARQATGNQNRLGFEINGAKGALRFDFERMNELEYNDATAPRHVQGWTNIMATHGGSHPYADAWWPDAHVLGYENSFVNHAYDVLLALAGKKPTVPLPDFNDAYQTQRVLEAAMLAAKNRCAVKLSEVK